MTTSGSGYACIIIVTSLSKMYCSQGDQRFRFLLNRFWAAPPFSKVCWLALLISHHYRKLSKKREKVKILLEISGTKVPDTGTHDQGRDPVLSLLLHTNTGSR